MTRSSDQIEELKHWWKDGLTMREIAERWHTTRNAVAGLIWRHHLTLKLIERTPTTPKTRPHRQPAVRRLNVINIKLKPAAPVATEAPPPGTKTLVELEPHDCRWPYGDDNFTFCGQRRASGSPYCPYHTLRASPPRKVA